MNAPPLPARLRRLLMRFMLVGVLFLALGGWQHRAAPSAAAAWWNTYSVITCGTTTFVGGESVLEWDGYFIASSGESYGTLWYWTGGSWDIASQAHDSATGVSGRANALTVAYFKGSSFYVTGSHGSTFFSGWKSSSSNTIYC